MNVTRLAERKCPPELGAVEEAKRKHDRVVDLAAIREAMQATTLWQRLRWLITGNW